MTHTIRLYSPQDNNFGDSGANRIWARPKKYKPHMSQRENSSMNLALSCHSLVTLVAVTLPIPLIESDKCAKALPTGGRPKGGSTAAFGRCPFRPPSPYCANVVRKKDANA
jgi:hypothetical protein